MNGLIILYIVLVLAIVFFIYQKGKSEGKDQKEKEQLEEGIKDAKQTIINNEKLRHYTNDQLDDELRKFTRK